MVRFVTIPQAVQHVDGVFLRRLFDEDRSKTTVERAVFLDVLAVFVQCGRTDGLQFAAREGGLHHIARVHCTTRCSCADELMQFVDEQDNLACRALDFFNGRFEAFFKLTAEAAASQHRRKVKRQHALVQQRFRHIAIDNFLG